VAETEQIQDGPTRERAGLPSGDYVSPGFQIIRPDSCFPNMQIGDPRGHPWPYLRSEIPHNWYSDRRSPGIGFVNRDEAHILYNTALCFSGRQALEIGCWLGWSACHIALGGVILDVVDPTLANPPILQSVRDSLTAAGVQERVNLVAAPSPEVVPQLAARSKTRWSLIFIDGDHEKYGPTYDAAVCAEYAERDALILFHDLVAPEVAAGLEYFRRRGWNTVIYSTMQIMGAAWRGNVKPVLHYPDPKVQWVIPPHLRHFQISGATVGAG
jgi:predicted O-methyltransferase YrrM